jgi:hypothetical protein
MKKAPTRGPVVVVVVGSDWRKSKKFQEFMPAGSTMLKYYPALPD